MRVTFVLGSQASGGARVVAMHARHLIRRGHTVTVLVPKRPPPSLRKRLRNFVQKGYWSPPPITGDHLFMDIDFRWVRPEEISTGSALPDADVLVATWWETAEWILSAPPSKGARIHLVQDHEVFDYLPVERVKAVYRHPMPKVVVSSWLERIMRQEYQAEEVMLVPNAVDTDAFNAGARAKQSVPTFGFVYNRAERKGSRICIEAIERVKRTVPNLRVLSFGTELPGGQLALPNWVEFSHFPPEDMIRDTYASCDAWLYPSISEGFGLPVLEAMACRTPVIGTAAGAGEDYISDKTGALVDGSVESFVEQITRFAAMDESEWQRLSEGARRRVEGYTWDDGGRLLEGFLQRALQRADLQRSSARECAANNLDA